VATFNIMGHLVFDARNISWDAVQYRLFQDLSILGGLVLLLCLGPGGISIDGKKSL
jgi:uncharacterized membrane protein YphA (DoxX/SURF4 family)